MLGHNRKNPSSGSSEHNPLPPAQFSKPVSIRWTPIRITVGPVTMGGNTFCRAFGGKNEIKISVKAQRAQVPISAPYASGQGNRFPSASSWQVPLAYIWLKAPVATGMMAKEVPTTEIRPVPM